MPNPFKYWFNPSCELFTLQFFSRHNISDNKMYKSLVALALLATTVLAQGDYHVDVYNSANRKITFYEYTGYRACYCLKNTQTTKIYNRDGGDVKLFSTNDCTGSYSQLAQGKTQLNAQWVNSMSLGKSGIASRDPSSCPNYFA